jgi:REG-2-like HAD superfamily hydrolase
MTPVPGMTLQAVFIDVGNTLVYEEPSRFEIYAETARERGLTIRTEDMDRMMRQAHKELPQEVGGAFRYTDLWFEAYIERIFHDYLGLEQNQLAPLRAELFGRFSEPSTFDLFPGTLELLDRFRERGLVLGLVSNWSARLPKLMDALDISPRVDFVVTSAIERCEKPDPAIWKTALERAEVPADRALHAGDDVEKDLLGARRAGLRSVLVDHHGRHGSVHSPRVGNLFELEELVLALT